jgi:hypothetical protein
VACACIYVCVCVCVFVAVAIGLPSRNVVPKSRFDRCQGKVKANVGCVIGEDKMVLHALILPDDRFQHQIDQVLEILEAQMQYIKSTLRGVPPAQQLLVCRAYLAEVIYLDDARRFTKGYPSF